MKNLDFHKDFFFTLGNTGCISQSPEIIFVQHGSQPKTSFTE